MLVFCRLSRLIQSIIIAPNIGSWCGTAEVTIGEKVRAVHEDEIGYIPIGSVHRLANKAGTDRSADGSNLDDDDIERVGYVCKRSAPKF